MAVSVFSKGQATILQRLRHALRIKAVAKVKFDLDGGSARPQLATGKAYLRVDDGSAILSYRGPRIPIEAMRGGQAMKKDSKLARS